MSWIALNVLVVLLPSPLAIKQLYIKNFLTIIGYNRIVEPIDNGSCRKYPGLKLEGKYTLLFRGVRLIRFDKRYDSPGTFWAYILSVLGISVPYTMAFWSRLSEHNWRLQRYFRGLQSRDLKNHRRLNAFYGEKYIGPTRRQSTFVSLQKVFNVVGHIFRSLKTIETLHLELLPLFMTSGTKDYSSMVKWFLSVHFDIPNVHQELLHLIPLSARYEWICRKYEFTWVTRERI
jgi:hypothetical protein